ncbi:MAG: amino acid ABC transporter substrate-binding protein [Actinomycetia bacterium]|nr:amino acid ABC transporter substrate-binding protein [Actinomycetes bacterium]
MVQGGDLLTTVKDRGTLKCGVSGTAVAFSETQADGSVTGFDADYCRAVAAAVLGDATAIEFVALTAAERFTAVQTGDVDVLMRNTTWTQSRDTDLAMDFGPTTYYDGQQIMGRKADGFTSSSTVADLEEAIVCTNAGTTTEKNIADAADAAGVTITLSTGEDFVSAMEGLENGSCDVVTTDGSGLVGEKATRDTNDEWVIFPASPISKEPLGPTYGQNDSQWADVINWVVYATIIADENDVTSANAQDMAANPPTVEIGRLLGSDDGQLQTLMGLEADAFLQVILQVGNYDEIYTNNLGPVGLSRSGSPNAGYLDGGLIYAPPAR